MKNCSKLPSVEIMLLHKKPSKDGGRPHGKKCVLSQGYSGMSHASIYVPVDGSLRFPDKDTEPLADDYSDFGFSS